MVHMCLSNIPVGQIGYREEYMMAAGDKFEIRIKGRGGRGSMLHLAIDPVLIGSQIVMHFQKIEDSRINTTDPTVVTVCSFQGGDTYNIIPDQAILSGTVRTFSKEARESVEKNIRYMAESVCHMAGAECGYPSVWNHPQEAQRVRRMAAEVVAGKENVLEIPLQMQWRILLTMSSNDREPSF
ncbi:peptidase dimerization domain-containing protein [Bacillus sp. V3B]|uniref:M20 metallopeptidase family protein n=1 Tax=Bacillus sp. V3B TaxID=2804915 RepID=UPI00210D106E|nr:peptidase dimerization domain-containing protein [Bacillus sp. V3B]MCQ6275452.1 peptidase dimerization domain-containing protein [Bacillus sp. V3B]